MKVVGLVFNLMNIILGIGALKFEIPVGVILIITNVYLLTLGLVEMKQEWSLEE